MSWNFVRMLIIIISRSSLKLGHVGLKTRSLDQQATQVSDLGPLWPSCFQKRWFFSWNISSWCMPQLERFLNIWNFFYSYVQDIQSSVSSTFLRYLRLLNALEGTLFWKKMIFSWNISSWCMPKFDRFLIIWNEFYSYVQGKKHLVFSTIFVYLRLSYALYGTFFSEKKRWFFMNYFKFVHAPTWQNSLLYDRFSIHMYKARSIGYLQHAPTWKIPYYMLSQRAVKTKITNQPYYMTGFLFICTRQEAFDIFNNFPLSASLLCLVPYIFRKKMIFHEIFQVGAGPNLKDSLLYDRFSIHMYKA